MTDLAIRTATRQDINWIAQTHGTLYRRDEGFDESFEPLVHSVLDDFMDHHDPTRERGWVVTQSNHRVGSLFCTRLSQEVAKLRLFLLLPDLRGRGHGLTLLKQAMRFAQGAGYRVLQVATYDRHAAACALYRRAGFALIESKPARAFGHDMIEQTWQIRLVDRAPAVK